MDNEKNVILTSYEEQDRIGRKMLSWINTFPEKPVATIDYSRTLLNAPAMALEPIQSAKVIKQYSRDNYLAEFQFKVVYRIRPSGNPKLANDERLSADELLNRIGDWATGQKPDIGQGYGVLRLEATSRAALLAPYDDGDEDRQILMKLIYYYKGGKN